MAAEFQRRTDATVQYQSELDQKLGQLYPKIEADNVSALDAYNTGVLNHVSFTPRVGHLTNTIIHKALGKASDEKSYATYSEHGAEHAVFQESILALQRGIEGGRCSCSFSTVIKDYKIGSALVKYPVQRFVIETNPFKRQTLRPNPLIESRDLPNNEKAAIKKLRAIGKNTGIPYAAITAFYAGYEVSEILDIFGNREYRNSFPKDMKILINSRKEDVAMLTALSKTLVVISPTGRHPVYSTESYTSAINIFEQYGWGNDIERHNQSYELRRVTENVRARSVFKGMTEIAQEVANPLYLDPARSEYIGRKYENVATTNLITSFLAFT